MSLLTKWPRTLLSAFSLLMLLGLVGSFSSVGTGAAPNQQSQTPTPTSQPSKPILLTDAVPDPKQPGVLWFPQTGHTLRGAFLDYWNRYGGLAQFGYPLTEEFFEEAGADHKQYQVQYFERNRFELHPENKDPQYGVLLGTLGLDFRKADAAATPVAGATYFKETGHNLSGKFKAYWDTHGGLFVHGYPITEPQMEKSTNGKEYLTQWFERSRMELHPENAGTPYEVLLGVLGRQLSEKKGFPFGWYPRYGYAPDFSWLAGQLELRYSYDSQHYYTGCNVLRYNQSVGDARVQVDGPGWTPFILLISPAGEPNLRRGDFLVLFGHRARAGEQYWYCKAEPVPGYIIDRLQMNPEQ